jgi:hypothetical protein
LQTSKKKQAEVIGLAKRVGSPGSAEHPSGEAHSRVAKSGIDWSSIDGENEERNSFSLKGASAFMSGSGLGSGTLQNLDGPTLR